MKKLTKKLVKEKMELKQGERIVDIDILDGKFADIITITKRHNINKYDAKIDCFGNIEFRHIY